MTSGQVPSIFYEGQYTPEPQLITLDPSKFTFNIILLDIEERQINQKKDKYLFVPQVRLCTRSITINGGFQVDCQVFYVPNCDIGFQEDLMNEMKLQSTLAKNSYCLSEEQWKNYSFQLQGYGQSEHYKYITIDAIRCTNNTFPGVQELVYLINISFYSVLHFLHSLDNLSIFFFQLTMIQFKYMCSQRRNLGYKPQNIFNQQLNKLKQGWIAMYFSDQQIKPSNDDPYQVYGKLMTSSFILSKFTQVLTYWRHIETQTKKNFFYFFGDNNQIDRSIIFQRSEVTQGLDLHKNIFVSFAMLLDDKKTILNRSYNNILNIFGDVGGLLSLLLTIGKIIVIPLANNIFRINLAMILYSNEKKTNQESAKIHHQENENFYDLLQLYQEDLNVGSIKEFKNETVHYLSLLSKRKIDQIQIKPVNYIFGNRQTSLALEKVNQNFDVIHLMKKLQEIDLIKKIVFTKEQRKIFNFLKKPSISSTKTKQPNQEIKKFNKIKKISKFLKALENTTNNSNKSEQDLRLIELLDQNHFQLYNKTIQEFKRNKNEQIYPNGKNGPLDSAKQDVLVPINQFDN